MPDHDDSRARAAGRARETQGQLSRRSVLKGAAGVGAAGVAASALAGIAVPAAAAATKVTSRTSRGSAEAHGSAEEKAGEAVVVHVRNAASGEIDVYRGTRQVRLHDRDLAARLVRASR
jgi:anaerobic selenocysteine-containing dehydrogenase